MEQELLLQQKLQNLTQNYMELSTQQLKKVSQSSMILNYLCIIFIYFCFCSYAFAYHFIAWLVIFNTYFYWLSKCQVYEKGKGLKR